MSEIRYIEVTDENDPKGVQTGVHSVEAGTPLPIAQDGQSYRWITEDEARKVHPALFGIAPEVDPTDMAEQIAALQELLHGPK